MRVEALVAEIGSTTTVVSAFGGLNRPEGAVSGPGPVFYGQGAAPTTVVQGDVTAGLRAAMAELEWGLRSGGRLGPDEPLEWGEMLACSSAAGGLKMTVHGLVYDMTVKAAREAALGAGAVIHLVTAGPLGPDDVEQIRLIGPNLILLAGGVDFGEKGTVLGNALALAGSEIRSPVVYAGNSAAAREVREILEKAGIDVTVVDNVYPRLDDLRIEAAGQAIQAAFEKHITVAPGMDKVRTMVTGTILPTPGAVMNAARLLYDAVGDLVVLDVGGATTDVHSVTPGSEEIAKILVAPEPLAKRTVEGDLGVFVNASRVADQLGLTLAPDFWVRGPIPSTLEETAWFERLAAGCVRTAVTRHAGRIRHFYGTTGRTTLAEGKDLSRVRWLIGTGGPLTRLPGGHRILEDLKTDAGRTELWPPPQAGVLIDRHYIMAACGVLAAGWPEAALGLLRVSLGIGEAA